ERVVLKRGCGITPQQARQTADLLALDRIAFVGHRRRAFLSRGEGFLNFPNFRALQVANLRGEFLERRPNYSQHRQVLALADPLESLSRGAGRLEPQPPAPPALPR